MAESNLVDAFVYAISGLSPIYKKQRTFFPDVVRFLGEEIQWIARVTTSGMFRHRGTSSQSTVYVEMGVSPYRVIFVDRSGFVLKRCRSFWFKIDFEGEIYKLKKMFKTKRFREMYTDLEFKKRKKMYIAVKGVIADSSKVENISEKCEISGIKGFDPSTKKYKKKDRDKVFDILEEKQKNSIPLTLEPLRVLRYDTKKLNEIILPTKEGEGVKKKAAVKPKQTVRQKDEEKCPNCGSVIKAGAVFCGSCGASLKTKKGSEAGEKCPQCGANIKPGIAFCGNCGFKFKEKEKVQKKIEKEKIETKKPNYKQDKKCPSCGKKIMPEWKVCPHCAKRLVNRCPSCEHDVKPQWVACPYCGGKLERKN